MAYKSLLTVMTETKFAKPALAQLVALAEAQDGHAEALCLGVDRSQTGYYYAGANALILQETLKRANAEADEVLAFAEDFLGKSGVRWSAENGVAQIADLGRHVAHRAILTVTRYTQNNQIRVPFMQGFRPDTRTFKHAWPEIFNKYVGAFNQSAQDVPAFARLPV